MHPIAKLVLQQTADLPYEDPVFQTIRVLPCVAANVAEEPVICPLPEPAVFDRSGLPPPGWSLAPDGAYAFHTNEFGYVNCFPLKFEREGCAGVHPDMDLSALGGCPFMLYAISDGVSCAALRAILALGLHSDGQEPCYTWVSPPDYSRLEDTRVLDELEAAGRLRPLLPADIPEVLSVW